MRCRHCDSEMEQTDQVAEGRVRQVWYRCPLCAASNTVSQPHQTPLRRIGNLQRCSGELRREGCDTRGLF